MIKVLIADDSSVVRLWLTSLVEAQDDMVVVAQAVNGEDAVRLSCELSPDVVAMDIHMPKMDGYAATKQIMQCCPTAIVIVSALVQQECSRETFIALDVGAVAVVPKPRYGAADDEGSKFVQILREVSMTKIRQNKIDRVSRAQIPLPASPAGRQKNYRLVVVGSSTGGPVALQKMLQQLPADFALPVVVVQHISPGFITGMVDWLDKSCNLSVTVAVVGEKVQPGHVYFAPDGAHMGVNQRGEIIFNDKAPLHSVKPAVSYLFSSSGVNGGKGVIAVLLTGMGCDGAQELFDLQQQGAVTLLQDEASCVVYGMPGVAAKLGGGNYHLPPEKIARQLTVLAQGQRTGK